MTGPTRLLRAAALATLALGLLSSTALAAGGGAGFSLRPIHSDPTEPSSRSYFIIDAAPGDVVKSEVLVSNNGTIQGSARIYPVDATTDQTSGATYSAENDARHGVGSWITLGEQEVTLKPGANRTVPFTIAIPPDARPGQHLGGLAVQNKTVVKSTGGGAIHVNLQTRMVVAVQLNLAGPSFKSVTITNVRPGGDKGYQTVLLGLSNDGTELVKPSGIVTISDAQGEQLQRLPIELDTLVPQTTIEYPVYLTSALDIGKYLADVQLDYGGDSAAVYSGEFSVSQEEVARVFASPKPAPLTPPPSTVLTMGSNQGQTSPILWWASGAAVLALAGAAGFVAHRRRHRQSNGD